MTPVFPRDVKEIGICPLPMALQRAGTQISERRTVSDESVNY